MIVSIAIAVLPVWRSPMISSRWPRPIGIIESIALRPVCIGSVTGWRWTTPGALNSAGRFWEVLTSPLPSSGRPSGSTMRPTSSSPTGISRSWFVRLTVSPSTIRCQSPNSTTPTLSDSRLRARPVTSCGSSSISNDIAFSRPWMRAMPSATDRTVPTSVRSAWPASRPSMRLLRMDVISSGLICMVWLSVAPGRRLGGRGGSGRADDLLAQGVEAVADGRVEDLVADADDDPAEDVRLDGGRELDLLAGLLLDPLADVADRGLVELDRGRDLHRKALVMLTPEGVVPAPDAEQHGHPVVLHQQVEEVHEDRLRSRDGAVQPVLLLLRGEVRGEEEHLQLAVAGERVGELAELLAQDVDLVLLERGLEQGAGVDGGDLLHQRSPRSSRPPERAAKSSSATASSTRRRWSSAVSVLRVTFSVAMIVRSATSARISWIARRVSASMSRRACSSSSSRRCLPAATASACCCSPALRARATISSACWRAAVRRSRYSASSSSASLRVRSAVSIDSSIARWRRSSASPMRGNATFQRMNIDTPNRNSVQTISPMPGSTRKLPPLSSSACAKMTVGRPIRGRRRSGPPRARRRSTPRSARSPATGFR